MFSTVVYNFLSKNNLSVTALAINVCRGGSGLGNGWFCIDLVSSKDMEMGAQLQQNLVLAIMDKLLKRCSVSDFITIMKHCGQEIPDLTLALGLPMQATIDPQTGWSQQCQVDLFCLKQFADMLECSSTDKNVPRKLRATFAAIEANMSVLSDRLRTYIRVCGTTGNNNSKAAWDQYTAMPECTTLKGFVASDPVMSAVARQTLALTNAVKAVEPDGGQSIADNAGDALVDLLSEGDLPELRNFGAFCKDVQEARESDAALAECDMADITSTLTKRTALASALMDSLSAVIEGHSGFIADIGCVMSKDPESEDLAKAKDAFTVVEQATSLLKLLGGMQAVEEKIVAEAWKYASLFLKVHLLSADVICTRPK